MREVLLWLSNIATTRRFCGRGFMEELTRSLHVLDPKYQELKYSSPSWGRMCDEWPLIAYPDRWSKVFLMHP